MALCVTGGKSKNVVVRKKDERRKIRARDVFSLITKKRETSRGEQAKKRRDFLQLTNLFSSFLLSSRCSRYEEKNLLSVGEMIIDFLAFYEKTWERKIEKEKK
jgi:hypothetical protein